MRKRRVGFSKKDRIALCIIVICVVFLLCLWMWNKSAKQEFGTSGLYTQEQLEEVAEKVAIDVGNGDYDSIYAMCSENILETMQEVSWETEKAAISTDWGDYVSYETYDLGEISRKNHSYGQIKINAIYENAEVSYNVTIGEDGKLEGLRFLPTETVEEEK